jgi:hypothetical protein
VRASFPRPKLSAAIIGASSRGQSAHKRLAVPLFAEAHRAALSLDAARRRRDPLGPLHGLPISVKESVEVARTASTLGLTSRVRYFASSDAPQVRALKQASELIRELEKLKRFPSHTRSRCMGFSRKFCPNATDGGLCFSCSTPG